MWITIISILGTILVFFSIYVVYYSNKIQSLELEILDLFKRKNYKIISIYSVSERFLNKHKEIFKEFIELKKRDFSENIHNLGLQGKLPVFKKIHKEIDFIFRVCQKHPELNNDPIYNYTKENIETIDEKISSHMKIYKTEKEKYDKIHKISKFFIVGFLIK